MPHRTAEAAPNATAGPTSELLPSVRVTTYWTVTTEQIIAASPKALDHDAYGSFLMNQSVPPLTMCARSPSEKRWWHQRGTSMRTVANRACKEFPLQAQCVRGFVASSVGDSRGARFANVRSMTTDEAPAAEKRITGGFRYAAATFVLIGAVSTLSQMAAVASLGYPVTWDWSSGGLVGIIASIWMWLRCRSWAAWRKWVWVPAIITVVIAFVTINLMTANAEKAAAEDRADMCSAAESQLASMTSKHEALLDETWGIGHWFGERSADWRPQEVTGAIGTRTDRGSSADDTKVDWEALADGKPNNDEWAFYVSNGGPQLETEVSEFQSDYAWECGTQ